MQGIALIPIAAIDYNVAEYLSFALHDLFDVPCEILHTDISIDQFYNGERQQYHSTEILRRILPFAEGNNYHFLAITDVDLYIPILTFVYGEAQLGKNCALISIFRLHQKFYGLPEDETILLQRCEKEAVHELGHTLGLVHCDNFECVMHYSHSIEFIDIKRNVFCPACSNALGIRSLW